MKLNYIDALRGIAIILVIIVHTGQYGESIYNSTIGLIIGQGARGVQLFYMTSAFTLLLSYNFRKGKEKHATRNFFIRRFFRIAPMYYLGIIYFIFQNGLGARYWLGDATEITTNNILANVFFIHGVNPYWITSLVPGGWSITVEMTFYLLFPILVSQIKSLKSAINFTVLSLVFLLFLKFIFVGNPLISSPRLWEEFLFLFFPSQFPVFGLGIISYYIIIEKQKTLSRLNIILIVLMLLSQFLFQQYIPGHIIISVFFLIFIWLIAKYEFKILVNKITQFMGKISYSAYFIHFAVLFWLNKYSFVNYYSIATQIDSLGNFFIRLLIVLFFTSVLSYLTFNLVEKPFMNIGKRIILMIKKD
jgi:peptidoglycan/LPS O-acetylase OafA/YrhL